MGKGSFGGSPPDFDTDLHKERYTVERGLGHLNQWHFMAATLFSIEPESVDSYEDVLFAHALDASTIAFASD
jgi:hypothetical protein